MLHLRFNRAILSRNFIARQNRRMQLSMLQLQEMAERIGLWLLVTMMLTISQVVYFCDSTANQKRKFNLIAYEKKKRGNKPTIS